MEYPLTKVWKHQLCLHYCLNPCCNGIPSDLQMTNGHRVSIVLIPVVMEYPLTTITELERDGVTS